MTTFFLIFLITIKARIALILQCVNINRQYVTWEGTEKKNILYTSIFLISTHNQISFISFLGEERAKFLLEDVRKMKRERR